MSKPIPLLPGNYYHIYNRGNNRGNIFLEDRNYSYFMKLYTKHIIPIADTYAYCLLRNHFHLLVRIKSLDELISSKTLGVSKTPRVWDHRIISQKFGNLFNAYSKTINKTYNRTGSLFQNPFKRMLITDMKYLIRVVIYIHRNPQHHGFVDEFQEWAYSSYNAMTSEDPTQVLRESVLEWFDGIENFKQLHETDVVVELDDLELKP